MPPRSIQRLRRRVKNASDDASRVDAMAELARGLRYRDYRAAIEMCEGARDLAGEIGYDTGRATAELQLTLIQIGRRHADPLRETLEQLIGVFEAEEREREMGEALLGLSFLDANMKTARQVCRRAARLLQKAGDHTGTGVALARLAAFAVNQQQYRRTEKYVAEILELAATVDDPRLEALAYRQRAWVYNTQGKFDRSLEWFRRALECCTASDEADLVTAETYANMSGVYERLGDHVEGLRLAMAAVEICRSVGFRQTEATALHEAGIHYRRMGDWQSALTHYLQSIAAAREVGNIRAEGHTLNSIANVYSDQEQAEPALEHYTRSLELAERVSDTTLQLTCIDNIGGVYLYTGNVEMAIEYFERSLDLSKRINYQVGIAFGHWRLGEAYLKQKRFDQAIEQGVLAQDISSQIGYRANLADAHLLLSNAYRARGRGEDLEAAFRHYQEYTRVKEETLGHEKQREMSRLQMRAEVEAAEQKRRLVELENQNLQLEMRQKSEELNAMAVRLVEKSELIDSLRTELQSLAELNNEAVAPAIETLQRQIAQHGATDEEWDAFERQLDTVHQGFLVDLSTRHPDLTPAELKVCALLRTQLSTKEIASLLNVTNRAVEKHRFSIRKKLGLKSGENLTTKLTGKYEG